MTDEKAFWCQKCKVVTSLKNDIVAANFSVITSFPGRARYNSFTAENEDKPNIEDDIYIFVGGNASTGGGGDITPPPPPPVVVTVTESTACKAPQGGPADHAAAVAVADIAAAAARCRSRVLKRCSSMPVVPAEDVKAGSRLNIPNHDQISKKSNFHKLFNSKWSNLRFCSGIPPIVSDIMAVIWV